VLVNVVERGDPLDFDVTVAADRAPDSLRVFGQRH